VACSTTTAIGKAHRIPNTGFRHLATDRHFLVHEFPFYFLKNHSELFTISKINLSKNQLKASQAITLNRRFLFSPHPELSR